MVMGMAVGRERKRKKQAEVPDCAENLLGDKAGAQGLQGYVVPTAPAAPDCLNFGQ